MRITQTIHSGLFFFVLLSMLLPCPVRAVSPSVLDESRQPVFSEDWKEQLKNRERPTPERIREGHLTPGTWTVEILDSKVIRGHNPVNSEEPLYNFTLNGVNYSFNHHVVEDPGLILKVAIAIDSQGAAGLDLNNPETKKAVAQLEQISKGSISINPVPKPGPSPAPGPSPSPEPGPDPLPPVVCTPHTLTSASDFFQVPVGILVQGAGAVSCNLGNATGAIRELYIQNPMANCATGGRLFFSDSLAGSDVRILSPGAGMSRYNGPCGDLNAVEAMGINHEALLRIDGKNYRLRFSTAHGGLVQGMTPVPHSLTYLNITVYDVSLTPE